MKSAFKYISFIVLACVFAACQDDFDFRTPGEIPEGTTTVVAEVDFMPLSESLSDKGESRATVAPPGNAMNELSDVCLLFYNKAGKLMYIKSEADFKNFELSDPERTDDDAENGITAESTTRKASFTFDIAFGEYYIYAVANLGQRDGADNAVTTTLDVLNTPEIKELIQSPDGLKSIVCTWDASNYRNNREMMGFFTDPSTITQAAASRARSSEKMQSVPLIRIATDNMTIHSWLKRVASKVTIEFDGSNLRDHVNIYIRKATIHHIPKTVKLGLESSVSSEDDFISTSSHHLDYGLGNDYRQWPCITRNTPTITRVADGATLPSHDENAYALYFYENNLGSFEGDERYDKRQYPSVFETVKDRDDLYDKLPCGTYIEVEGYYVGSSSSNQSEGIIRYRFMLGQDTRFDYNATRNCHYKLTMHFRGNANDVDWHIDYDEEFPQIFAPDIYYISYLYDRTMTMPVRVNEGKTHSLIDLKTEIICNHWAPEDPYKSIRKQYPTSDDYEFTWNTVYYDEHRQPVPPAMADEDVNPEVEPMDYNDDLWTGFLSLRKTHDVTILNDVTSDKNHMQGGKEKLQIYWEEHKIGERSYKIPTEVGIHNYNTGDDSPHKDGAYSVERGDSTYVFNMPFYTRERQLSPYLAWTANNPYSYPRKAVVRITATFKDNKTGAIVYRRKRVTIQQVERIQNPKGVYRNYDNDEAFDVYLMRSDPENLDRFVEIISDGPWRAEIVGDQSSWILLNNGTKTIYGSSGTPIRFRVKPSGTITEDRVRNGAVRVYYNNYTCVHLVLMRQGYAPIVIPEKVSGGSQYHSTAAWASFNLFDKTHFMQSPLAAGSYFRYGNLDQPINESNNLTYGLGQDVNNKSLVISGKFNADGSPVTAKWKDIGVYRQGTLISSESSPTYNDIATGVDYFGTIRAKGYDGKTHTFRIASFEDYKFLLENTETAYGVVYADGATYTATTTDEAYRFLDPTGTLKKSTQGMRGVICYAWDTEYNTGKFEQVFFPISASGYGRRKQWISEGTNRGVLRYGDVSATIVPPRIQVFDLCQTPGAMYWFQKGAAGGFNDGVNIQNTYSWDINYYTYAFDTYTRNAFGWGGTTVGSDALLIKWVQVD